MPRQATLGLARPRLARLAVPSHTTPGRAAPRLTWPASPYRTLSCRPRHAAPRRAAPGLDTNPPPSRTRDSKPSRSLFACDVEEGRLLGLSVMAKSGYTRHRRTSTKLKEKKRYHKAVSEYILLLDGIDDRTSSPTTRRPSTALVPYAPVLKARPISRLVPRLGETPTGLSLLGWGVTGLLALAGGFALGKKLFQPSKPELAMIYMRGCSACKEFRPEFDEAARELRKQGIETRRIEGSGELPHGIPDVLKVPALVQRGTGRTRVKENGVSNMDAAGVIRWARRK